MVENVSKASVMISDKFRIFPHSVKAETCENFENQRVNMIRTYISALLLVVFASSMSAQQDPQFTQWYMDHVMSNIAAAGQSELTNINGFYRNQWSGLDRSPVTSLLNIDGELGFIPGAFGIQFYQDELGFEGNTMAKVGYAYSLQPFAGGVTLSVGTSVSYFSKTFKPNWIAIDDWTQDNAIPSEGETGSAIDVDLGVYISKPKSFYAGLSMTHIAQTELKDGGTLMSIKPVRHLYAMGGYNYPLDGDALILRTNILAKTDLNASAIDMNVNVLYNEMIWAGVSWRPGDAIAPIVGFQYSIINQNATNYKEQLFRIGYSFDMTTSELQSYSSGSHEVFLSYSFKFESTPILNRYANPRVL
ncbi:MAG TPA: type IX secretion system membrane protein PorP/SprF [Flavobacteriales bacterium]|nr:type IX secretion system membrane protein PorP/SprF [Flavobacteriales bacterium]